MFAPAKLGENKESLFDTCSHECADVTHKESQGDLAGRRTLVMGLEGVGAARKYSVHSDKGALFTPFDCKRLFAVVRTALPRRGTAEPRLLLTDVATTPPLSPTPVFRSPSEYHRVPYPLSRKPPGPLLSDQEAKKDSKYAKTTYSGEPFAASQFKFAASQFNNVS
jgi:hypothetical protein